jgi:hypothetical protein
MAETTDDVRRDIELTRERMSDTFAQLEQKLNVMEMVKSNPWPAIALAVGAGVLLSGSGSDVKAAAATVAATKGASNKLGTALDDVVAQLMSGVHGAIESRVEGWVGELKDVIGAAAASAAGSRSTTSSSTSVAASSMSTSTGDSEAPLVSTRAD